MIIKTSLKGKVIFLIPTKSNLERSAQYGIIRQDVKILVLCWMEQHQLYIRDGLLMLFEKRFLIKILRILSYLSTLGMNGQKVPT